MYTSGRFSEGNPADRRCSLPYPEGQRGHSRRRVQEPRGQKSAMSAPNGADSRPSGAHESGVLPGPSTGDKHLASTAPRREHLRCRAIHARRIHGPADQYSRIMGSADFRTERRSNYGFLRSLLAALRPTARRSDMYTAEFGGVPRRSAPMWRSRLTARAISRRFIDSGASVSAMCSSRRHRATGLADTQRRSERRRNNGPRSTTYTNAERYRRTRSPWCGPTFVHHPSPHHRQLGTVKTGLTRRQPNHQVSGHHSRPAGRPVSGAWVLYRPEIPGGAGGLVVSLPPTPEGVGVPSLRVTPRNKG